MSGHGILRGYYIQIYYYYLLPFTKWIVSNISRLPPYPHVEVECTRM